MIGGDFNEIKNNEEKRDGRRRQENSLSDFRKFIVDMDMGKVRFRGEPFTWANNREREGFIPERLELVQQNGYYNLIQQK